MFQSTHPRRVWQGGECPFYQTALVSIHTPTKGVTVYSGLYLVGLRCFNPHTHEGCDSEQRKRCVPGDMFQSTHPRRVWLGCPCNYPQMTFVSIHTPTKGVTNQLLSQAVSDVFQSTHPRRVWQKGACHIRLSNSFNPHTHEGCDAQKYVIQHKIEVSIHTPTKGVTKLWTGDRENWEVSIHTPTKGVTSVKYMYEHEEQFQSTHPRRVWLGYAVRFGAN